MAPDFAELLKSASVLNGRRRRGKVFRVNCKVDWAKKVVSKIGKTARVVTGQGGKFASAHDLRRAFGTRWAKRLAPAELQLMMRHESIDTTVNYYVGIEADDVGAKIASYRGGALGGTSSVDIGGDAKERSTQSE